MKKKQEPPWGACPVCGRPLGPFERVAWRCSGWRRDRFAGCGACFAPQAGEEVLVYEVWEAPEVWFLKD